MFLMENPHETNGLQGITLMNKDPIIEEVRKVRKEIAKEYLDFPEAYFLHLQEIQKKFKKGLVRRKSQCRVKRDERFHKI